MPANIYSAAFALQPAWHGLGKVLDHVMTWREAMQAAGLDWTVSKRDLWVNVNGVMQKVNGFQVVCRDSDNEQLGVVTPSYHCIQNEYAFTFCDTIIEAEDGAHYESAGALGNGDTVWVLARVPKDIRIDGTDDVHQTYLLFATAHDGTMSAVGKITDVRVVCQNTYNQALRGAGAMVRVRHTVNAQHRLDEAKRLMKGVGMDVKALEEKFNVMARRQMTKESMLDALNRIFPPSDKEKQDATTTNARRENVIGEVLANYDNNDNNAFPVLKGTAYALFNAVTRYVDHGRSVRLTSDRVAAGYTPERARAENAMFGTGETLKTNALVAVLAATEKIPTREMPRMYASADIGTPILPPAPPAPKATPDHERAVMTASDDTFKQALQAVQATPANPDYKVPTVHVLFNLDTNTVTQTSSITEAEASRRNSVLKANGTRSAWIKQTSN